MLSFSALPPRWTTAKNLTRRRTTIVQHTLNFFDLPIPEIAVWETLENEPRTVAIAVLARLMVQAVWALQKPEEDHD
jgi:hypothetical protein